MCTQAKPFCAVCVEYIVGAVRRESIDGVEYTVCDRCATTKAKVINRPIEVDSRSDHMRKYRDRLVEQGYCANAKKHGPATDGQYCAKCAAGHRGKDQARRLRTLRRRHRVIEQARRSA